MPDVVVDVEMRIVDPDRPSDVERDELDHLPVARDKGQLRIDHCDDVFEERRRAFEDRNRRDVHMAHIVFDM